MLAKVGWEKATGLRVLKALADSSITTLESIYLFSNLEWFDNDDVVATLVTIITK